MHLALRCTCICHECEDCQMVCRGGGGGAGSTHPFPDCCSTRRTAVTGNMGCTPLLAPSMVRRCIWQACPAVIRQLGTQQLRHSRVAGHLASCYTPIAPPHFAYLQHWQEVTYEVAIFVILLWERHRPIHTEVLVEEGAGAEPHPVGVIQRPAWRPPHRTLISTLQKTAMHATHSSCMG